MKAKVIKTGEIVDVAPCPICYIEDREGPNRKWDEDELEFEKAEIQKQNLIDGIELQKKLDVIFDAIDKAKYEIKKCNYGNALESLCIQYKGVPIIRWKPSEQEITALRTAIHIMTEERSFPKLGAQLQNILDIFEGKTRIDWKPTEEQLKTLEYYMVALNCDEHKEILFGLYDQLKKLAE